MNRCRRAIWIALAVVAVPVGALMAVHWILLTNLSSYTGFVLCEEESPDGQYLAELELTCKRGLWDVDCFEFAVYRKGNNTATRVAWTEIPANVDTEPYKQPFLQGARPPMLTWKNDSSVVRCDFLGQVITCDLSDNSIELRNNETGERPWGDEPQSHIRHDPDGDIWTVDMTPELSENKETEIDYSTPPSGFTGVWCIQFSDGKKASEREYVNGVEHGLSQSWYHNGKRQHQCQLVAGRKHGVFRNWYDNGQCAMQFEFEKGVLQGPAMAWHRNGQRKYWTLFKNGDRLGVRVAWNQEGEIVAKEWHLDVTTVVTEEQYRAAAALDPTLPRPWENKSEAPPGFDAMTDIKINEQDEPDAP